VALSASLVKSTRTSNHITREIVRSIDKELKSICSYNHDSVLRDCIEGLRMFSWETIWLELLRNLPSLMKILSLLIPQHLENKPLLSFAASLILKKRSPKMGLVQRAVSLLLYGNGACKQVSSAYS
jgi:L1 cell adhesion molecule like protein